MFLPWWWPPRAPRNPLRTTFLFRSFYPTLKNFGYIRLLITKCRFSFVKGRWFQTFANFLRIPKTLRPFEWMKSKILGVARSFRKPGLNLLKLFKTTNEKSSQFKLIFLRRPSFNNIITKEMGCVKNKNFEIFWFGNRPSCDGRLSFQKISRTRVPSRGRPCAPFSYPDVPFPNTGM